MANPVTVIGAIIREAEGLVLSGVKPSLAILGRDYYKQLLIEVDHSGEIPLSEVVVTLFGNDYSIVLLEHEVKGVIAIYGYESIPEKDRTASKIGTPFFLKLRQDTMREASEKAMIINKLDYETLYIATDERIDEVHNHYVVKLLRCEYRFLEHEIIAYPFIGVQ